MLLKKELLKQVIKELNPYEHKIVERLYLDKNYPYNFFTVEDLKKSLNASKYLVSRAIESLEKKKLLKKERSRIMFVYPIKDIEFSRNVRVLIKKGINW